MELSMEQIYGSSAAARRRAYELAESVVRLTRAIGRMDSDGGNVCWNVYHSTYTSGRGTKSISVSDRLSYVGRMDFMLFLFTKSTVRCFL